MTLSKFTSPSLNYPGGQAIRALHTLQVTTGMINFHLLIPAFSLISTAYFNCFLGEYFLYSLSLPLSCLSSSSAALLAPSLHPPGCLHLSDWALKVALLTGILFLLFLLLLLTGTPCTGSPSLSLAGPITRQKTWLHRSWGASVLFWWRAVIGNLHPGLRFRGNYFFIKFDYYWSSRNHELYHCCDGCEQRSIIAVILMSKEVLLPRCIWQRTKKYYCCSSYK